MEGRGREKEERVRILDSLLLHQEVSMEGGKERSGSQFLLGNQTKRP